MLAKQTGSDFSDFVDGDCDGPQAELCAAYDGAQLAWQVTKDLKNRNFAPTVSAGYTRNTLSDWGLGNDVAYISLQSYDPSATPMITLYNDENCENMSAVFGGTNCPT